MSEESHSYELMEDPDDPNLSMSEIVDIVSENAQLRSRAAAAEAKLEWWRTQHDLDVQRALASEDERDTLAARLIAAEAQRAAALELARAAQVISDALHGTPMATSEALRELDEALRDWATVRVGPSDLAARLADATSALDALRAERNQLARDLDDAESERDDAEQLLADAQAEVQALREALERIRDEHKAIRGWTFWVADDALAARPAPTVREDDNA